MGLDRVGAVVIVPGITYDERDPGDPLGLTYAQRHASNLAQITREWFSDMSCGVQRAADGTKVIDGEVIANDLPQPGVSRPPVQAIGG